MGLHPLTGKSRFAALRSLALRSVTLTDKTMEALAAALYHSRVEKAAKGRRAYNNDDEDGAAGVGPLPFASRLQLVLSASLSISSLANR